MTALVLSLGSNLGDRLANLQLGLDVLGGGGLDLQAVSSVYETDPVGGPDQADYLNAVLLAGSLLPARDILELCATAEATAGRVRMERWGPRTLDVDIIVYGDEVSTDPVLTLPHPRAHEREFVLVPWLELDPQAALPGWGAVAGLLGSAPATAVRRRPDLRLELHERSSRRFTSHDGAARSRPVTGLGIPEADASCS
ncbi:MAG TPA: 2-amino-4-hydroxy-6-hydroxymethyldihydropteridine diphosphokinase [Streptosporangiaceae bacterium]|nr:2-amino-4-hydroxy-6-hydroxymethyldihydropteridine diphosphokinase [Streptosporangiaceae bacterium]